MCLRGFLELMISFCWCFLFNILEFVCVILVCFLMYDVYVMIVFYVCVISFILLLFEVYFFVLLCICFVSWSNVFCKIVLFGLSLNYYEMFMFLKYFCYVMNCM